LEKRGGDIMVTKKDIVIAIIATFCLTASMFMVTTSRSQTGSEYDPWADYNADGVIDIFDIVPVALTFGTAGDSTKNVTITNWPTSKLAYSIETSVGAVAGFETPYISVAGYSKICICIWNDAAQDQYWLYACHAGGWSFTADYAENMPNDLVKTYDVPNEQIRVRFFNHDAGSRYLKLDVYLIQ
jgi:hypothetical protein